MDLPSIVVHAPGLDGSRRVTAGDETLGIAYRLDDVVEIMRRYDLDETEVEENDILDWQGGGPDDWPGLTEHRAG